MVTVAQFTASNLGGGGGVGRLGRIAGGNLLCAGVDEHGGAARDWTPVLTNQFDTNGNFNFTNGMNTNIPQGYFIIQCLDTKIIV